jgi:1-aminocyclopropane-1-carboxylate deaminase
MRLGATRVTNQPPIEISLPSPLAELTGEILDKNGVRLYLKRDDLIHPEIPGNKWRKLKYNIDAARDEGCSTILTLGGSYSNHIRATAAAGHYFGFKTIGIIRGEEHLPLNPSLSYAVSRGMQLEYMNRETYRIKDQQAVIDRLHAQYGEFYLLPEGGSNAAGVRGCAELPSEIGIPFRYICCACGSGGTLAGISAGLSLRSQEAIGFPVLKGGDFLKNDIIQLQREAFGTHYENWRLETSFHFGGYAKRTAELDHFITTFKERHEIELDWVYEAKMMYGIYALVTEGRFDRGTEIVAVIVLSDRLI